MNRRRQRGQARCALTGSSSRRLIARLRLRPRRGSPLSRTHDTLIMSADARSPAAVTRETRLVGVDVGGTVTDPVLGDEATGEVRVAKISTTVANLGEPHRAFRRCGALARVFETGGRRAGAAGRRRKPPEPIVSSVPEERRTAPSEVLLLGQVSTAPSWKRGDEWAYRWKSPTGKGTFIWSVDREETLD